MEVDALENIIRSRFKTQVADAESVSVAYDNAPFDAPDGAIWIRFAILLGDTFQVECGGSTNTHRTSGIARAHIMAPIERGTKDSRELAVVIAQAFRSVSVSGVNFHGPLGESPSVRDGGRDGKWWQTIVDCPFYADNIV